MVIRFLPMLRYRYKGGIAVYNSAPGLRYNIRSYGMRYNLFTGLSVNEKIVACWLSLSSPLQNLKGLHWKEGNPIFILCGCSCVVFGIVREWTPFAVCCRCSQGRDRASADV